MKRQAVAWHLRAIDPTTREKFVKGNAAAAWTLAQLPPALLNLAETTRMNGNYRTVNDVFTNPRKRWQPALPLDKICEADIQSAEKLRAALQPWLIRQH